MTFVRLDNTPGACAGTGASASLRIRVVNFQEQYDDAMFDFSRGQFAPAAAKLRAVLAADATHFDAQLSLGMALYRLGDFAGAIAEGHKAEQLKPREQLVHTNLSLFYMKSGDKVKAEHHGLQARIAGWREDPNAAATAAAGDPELQLARPASQTFKSPEKFPDMPWKKKSPVATTDSSLNPKDSK